ncbi:tail fiber protein [Desulforamulus aquiferis]|uniref:Tail fiber protein n=1 Tax=Desulforamulus aquiferis TaxID=1397668 RepID=A0AAW7ZET5_9FIRM|nr:tail fiber protein [Desulforamulus aquiferis]MDO7787506.1 tail fiber protein [Desulforamulus aquiferis]
MADKKVQIKIKNGQNWDNIFPKTNVEVVEGLDTALNNKVDKVTGKGLSTEDYTFAEKTKLEGIEAAAQVNSVTSVANKTGAVALTKSDVGLGNVENYSIATQAESEAGTVTNKYMTPQRTKQAIAAQTANLGGGDMLKSVYDLNNNGKVDTAEQADSVPWAGIIGKPSEFTPESHLHSGESITSGTISAARLPNSSTTAKGAVQLNNTTNSTSTSLAATANAVKVTYDLASEKSKIVVSATEPTGADIWIEELV